VGVLLVGGLAVIAFAIWLSSRRHLEHATLAGDLVLPGLEQSVNSVTEVDLRRGDGTHASLKKASAGWVVGERDWAAEPGKVRKLLLDLGALNVVEEKTRLPANYPQLGVEDVSAPKATGTQIDVVTPARTFSLIVGKTSSAKSGFVRVAGAAPTLLAAPLLTPDADPKSWLERSLVDVPQTRIRQVDERPAAGASFSATRDKKEQPDFTVAPIPKGRLLTSAGAADSIAASLGTLTLEDVQKTAAGPSDAKAARAVFRTFDGLELEVAGRKDGSRSFITLAARSNAKDAEAEAHALNTRLAGWEFEIPEYKYGAIFRTLDDLLQPKPEKPAKPAKPAAKKAAEKPPAAGAVEPAAK
jgi:hypothetical protein